MFDPLKSLEKHLGEFDFNSRIPFYNDSSDYTTNAPSYYDDLARKNKLIKHLALRIWDYDKEMLKRLEEWDKNLEDFPEDVKKLLEKWLKDGTLDEIINETIFSWKADKEDLNGFGHNIEWNGVKKGIKNAKENTLIIQNLLDTYQNIIIPPGTFHFEGDIIAPYNSIIRGSGYLSEIVINNGGLIYPDGEKFTLKDFRLKRTGSVGPALDILAEGYGWRRFYMSNVHVLGSTGTGMRFKEGWIGTVINAVVQECNIGVEISRGEIYGASANSLNFYGGEFQANMIGLKAYGVKGLNFFGTCIEGNKLYGVHFQGSMRDVVFYGAYFEANGTAHGGKEIFLDTAYPDASPYNIRFDGGGFLRGSLGTFDVFDIRGGKNIVISDGVSFYGYQDARDPIIKVTEKYPRHTTGYVGAVLGNFKELMSNDTLAYGKSRVMSYGINKDFKGGERTQASFKVLPMENPTKNIKFKYTIYAETSGTFSLTEKWYKNDGTVIRDNIDGITVDEGFNDFERNIELNGYEGELNVTITRNGTSEEDVMMENVMFTQADIYVIDNPQTL